MEFMVGQRVISNGEIVVVVNPPRNEQPNYWTTWVRMENGIVQIRTTSTLKPLPNGQL